MKTLRQILLGKSVDPAQASKAMVLSLLLSCGILYGGMYWMWKVGAQANNLDHQLYHAQEGIEALRQYKPPKRGEML